MILLVKLFIFSKKILKKTKKMNQKYFYLLTENCCQGVTRLYVCDCSSNS